MLFLGIPKCLVRQLMGIFLGSLFLCTDLKQQGLFISKMFEVLEKQKRNMVVIESIKHQNRARNREWGNYSWYSWIAAAISASDHVFSLCPQYDCLSLLTFHDAFSCVSVKCHSRGWLFSTLTHSEQKTMKQKEQKWNRICRKRNKHRLWITVDMT